MKIKKFNESVTENWTENKIRKMCDDRSDLSILLSNYVQNVLKLQDNMGSFAILNILTNYWIF